MLILVEILMALTYPTLEPNSIDSDIISIHQQFLESFISKNLQGILAIGSSEENTSMLLGDKMLRGSEIKDYYTSTFEGLKSVDSISVRYQAGHKLEYNHYVLCCLFDETLTLISNPQVSYSSVANYIFKIAQGNWIIS